MRIARGTSRSQGEGRNDRADIQRREEREETPVEVNHTMDSIGMDIMNKDDVFMMGSPDRWELNMCRSKCYQVWDEKYFEFSVDVKIILTRFLLL